MREIQFKFVWLKKNQTLRFDSVDVSLGDFLAKLKLRAQDVDVTDNLDQNYKAVDQLPRGRVYTVKRKPRPRLPVLHARRTDEHNDDNVNANADADEKANDDISDFGPEVPAQKSF
jgi:hypothetical protein